MSASPVIRRLLEKREYTLFIILSLRTLPVNGRCEINVSRLNEFNVILFSPLMVMSPCLFCSKSYLHLTPERCATIYSKNRLHPFPRVEAKGNLYFHRQRKEARICCLPPGAPSFNLIAWQPQRDFVSQFGCQLNTATSWDKNNL